MLNVMWLDGRGDPATPQRRYDMSAKTPGTPMGELVTYFLRLGGADRSCLVLFR
jgi:hypothetical protein